VVEARDYCLTRLGWPWRGGIHALDLPGHGLGRGCASPGPNLRGSRQRWRPLGELGERVAPVGAPDASFGKEGLLLAGRGAISCWSGLAQRFDQVERASAGAVSAEHGDGREPGVRHNVGKCASRVLARVCEPVK
jgi:hypothetical protein